MRTPSCAPPGHHATKGSGGGFCVFNNVVVAAEHAFRRWGDQVGDGGAEAV